jgi:general stress protein YciG
MSLKHSKPTLAQCKATISSGKRCRAKPHKNGLCFFHSDPQKAAELGRKGGKGNRRTFEAPVAHVTAPESAGDVKRMLAESMAEVRTGKMDPKLGTTLAYIGASLLKAIEVADVDGRLKKLELTTEVEDPT